MSTPKKIPSVPVLYGYKELNGQLVGITLSYDLIILGSIHRGPPAVDLDLRKPSKSHKKKPPAQRVILSTPPMPTPTRNGGALDESDETEEEEQAAT